MSASATNATLGPLGRFAERVGIGATICVIVLAGIAWVGPNVVKPFVDQKIRSDAELAAAVVKLAVASEQTARAMVAVELGIERLNRNQDEVRENGAKNAETTRQNGEYLRQQATDLRELLNTVKSKPDMDPMGGKR